MADNDRGRTPTKALLHNYCANLAELAYLEAQRHDLRRSGRDGHNGPGYIARPTEMAAISLVDDPRINALRKQTNAVDALLRWVDQHPRRSQYRALLTALYFGRDFCTMGRAARIAGLSRPQAERANKSLLLRLESIWHKQTD